MPNSPLPYAASPSVAADSERPALYSWTAHVRFWLVVVAGLALDLWSKHWAFHALGQGGYRTLIPDMLEFRTTMNDGALFGIGRGQTTVFIVASLLALALVVWMFAQCPARRWFTQIGLAAILAGAMGNMYDRMFVRLIPLRVGGGVAFYEMTPSSDGAFVTLREYPPDPESPARVLPAAELAGRQPVGCVRDFIKVLQKWFFGREVWPWVFNVADMLLVGGVGVLALRLFGDRRRQAPSDAPGDESVRRAEDGSSTERAGAFDAAAEAARLDPAAEKS